jgi:hypothetical protein
LKKNDIRLGKFCESPANVSLFIPNTNFLKPLQYLWCKSSPIRKFNLIFTETKNRTNLDVF